MQNDKPKSPFRWKRIKNALINIFTNPYNIIVLVSLIVLVYFIVVPLGDIIATTFRVQQRDIRRIPGSAEGDFTLYYWNRLLFSDVSASLLWKPLVNSLLIGISTSVLSILIGGLLAWLVVRSDIPWKRGLSLLIIIPYILPSWSKSMAWTAVFKNARVGGVPGFLNSIGINTPDWLAYGPVPIILVLTIHYYAYAYLLGSSALQSINSELEEMGEIQGASKIKILSRITFPLVLPALLSAFILTFSKSIGTFSVPAYLGFKVNYNTISTMIYSQSTSSNKAVAYAIAMILIMIASVNIFLNQRAIGARKSYATIGGKGGRSTLLKLGAWRMPLFILVMVFLTIVVILPLLILILQTFMMEQGKLSLDNFTLHYWIGEAFSKPTVYEGEAGIFRNKLFWDSLWNTIKLVLSVSIIATLIGQMIGYITSRGRGKFSGRLVEQLVFIPYLIPSIAFGAVYMSMFAVRRGIMPALYGTFALLILISTVKNLPFAARSGTSSMMQIGTELEEAAQIEGASFLTRFARIITPLSKGGFFSGFMLIFIGVMKELDLHILLLTPKMSTLSYLAFSYNNDNKEPYEYGCAVIIFALTYFCYWIAGKIGKVDLAGSLGG
ncbi:MAG: iron ABC transporter permease [Anaerolineaceae bacterium]|nr:iron ABC transporter permease [Anaerolineaceae bacterium]